MEKTESNIISSLSVKGKPLEKKSTLKINDSNLLDDNKINQKSNIKNTFITQRITLDSKAVIERPNTIKNLSRPLIKKIQKKIRKRRKRKKLYKILISKINESLIKINPNANINLNTSMNNSFGFVQKNDNNANLTYLLHKSNFLQDNSSSTERMNINEGIVKINGQDLIIIPESSEFDSESSSRNSKSSNLSVSPNIVQKKVELSISENFNFCFNSKYENLNTISKGNYSKDINLRNSVMKLIGIYLKEKTKKNNNILTNLKKDSENLNKKEKEKSSNKDNSNINLKNKKNKNLTKKESSKKDVWAFLNENEQEPKINFNLNSSESIDSPIEEEFFSKTPKPGKFKNNFGFTRALKKKRKSKNNNNFFWDIEQEENNSPKSQKKKGKQKKKILKFKKGDVINIKTFTTIINPKKKKRNLKKEKSNKNNIISDNSHKKESNSNNNDFKLSSLDLSLDDMDQQETYLKNFYKTYQIKKNKLNEEDNKNDSRLDDFSNKGLNVK